MVARTKARLVARLLCSIRKNRCCERIVSAVGNASAVQVHCDPSAAEVAHAVKIGGQARIQLYLNAITKRRSLGSNPRGAISEGSLTVVVSEPFLVTGVEVTSTGSSSAH